MKNTDCLSPGRQGSALFFIGKYAVPWRLGGLLFFLFASCNSPAPPPQPAFFHWKTQLALNSAERACLDSLGCRYLYVKFLDIAREDGAIRPYALLELLDTAGLSGKTVIPCVFITNNVFQNSTDPELDWLADKTLQALNSVEEQFTGQTFSEIQFDCDWTATTRAAFFSFLKKVRSRLPAGTRISATIRLHQYKFPGQTGVPPADRGMIMLYNTGDIDDPDAGNSIFQTADAEKYIAGAAPYPLPLDVALPVFSWALVYRDADLWKIIPEPDFVELQDTSLFARLPEPVNAKYRCLKATILGGQYLRPGDLLRLESVDTATLRAAAQTAAHIRLAPDARMAFFHLDSAAISRYPWRFLRTFF